MFTGLIREVGTITDIAPMEDGLRLTIGANKVLKGEKVGASIACNGICLTAVEINEQTFTAELSKETLERTTAGKWEVGTKLNLEPSLRLGDALGGHLVFGHVDATTVLADITRHGECYELLFSLPPRMAALVAEKGSVCLNGISLTINDVSDHSFTVMIVPHTWQETSLADLVVGDLVNIEADMLARYVDRQMHCFANDN